MESTVLSIFLASLFTACATGLGALPLLATKGVVSRWLANGQASAAGMMLAATTMLIAEGSARGAVRVSVGMLIGVALITLAMRWLPDDLDIVPVLGARADQSALLLVALMTVHSLAEGIGIGVAFGGGEKLGLFVTVAIALHNVAEGLAISLVLVGQGASVLRAAMWSIVTSLPQVALAVPAFLFVSAFESILPFGFGFAAGAMIWMVVYSLLPEALAKTSPARTAGWCTGSMALLLALQSTL